MRKRRGARGRGRTDGRTEGDFGDRQATSPSSPSSSSSPVAISRIAARGIDHSIFPPEMRRQGGFVGSGRIGSHSGREGGSGRGAEYDSRQKSEDGAEEAATTQRLPWRGGGQVSLVALRIALLALASARTYLSGGEQRRVIVRAATGGREAECKPRSAAGHSCTLCNAASMSDDRVSNDDDPPPPRHRAALRRGGQSRGSE